MNNGLDKIQAYKYNFSVIHQLIKTIIHNENINQEDYSSQLIKFNFRELNKLDFDYKYFMNFIISNKITSFITNNNIFKELPEDLQIKLKKLRKKELINMLFDEHILKEVTSILNENSIKFLTFKGLALSYLSTNSLYKRGQSIDIDLLIQENDIQKTIYLLKNHGFSMQEKYIIFESNTLTSKFSRFCKNELTLTKTINNQICKIDLHWKISIIDTLMPRFEDLYASRKNLIISNQAIPTLNEENAFKLSCIHCAIDNWKCIRDFIDIERLSRKIPRERINNLSQIRLIKKSIELGFYLTDSPFLNLSENISLFSFKKKYSLHFQERSIKFQIKKRWSLKRRFILLFNLLILSKSPKEWLSIILNNFLDPLDLVDTKTGKQRDIFDFFILRIKTLFKKSFSSRTN